jgi:hypothetical protein
VSADDDGSGGEGTGVGLVRVEARGDGGLPTPELGGDPDGEQDGCGNGAPRSENARPPRSGGAAIGKVKDSDVSVTGDRMEAVVEYGCGGTYSGKSSQSGAGSRVPGVRVKRPGGWVLVGGDVGGRASGGKKPEGSVGSSGKRSDWNGTGLRGRTESGAARGNNGSGAASSGGENDEPSDGGENCENERWDDGGSESDGTSIESGTAATVLRCASSFVPGSDIDVPTSVAGSGGAGASDGAMGGSCSSESEIGSRAPRSSSSAASAAPEEGASCARGTRRGCGRSASELARPYGRAAG